MSIGDVLNQTTLRAGEFIFICTDDIDLLFAQLTFDGFHFYKSLSEGKTSELYLEVDKYEARSIVNNARRKKIPIHCEYLHLMQIDH